MAEPVWQPPRIRHSLRRSGPAAEWMAPSCTASVKTRITSREALTTPPPPRREVFAALTIEVTSRSVMDVRIRAILELMEADGGKNALPSVIASRTPDWYKPDTVGILASDMFFIVFEAILRGIWCR